MYILGISAYYHDSAAVLIKDGEVLFGIEEERLSRIKHDNQFPNLAVAACLNFANINISQVDYVAYYEKPLLKFERALENFIDTYPKSLVSFVRGLPEILSVKILVEEAIRNLGYKGKIFFIPHHLSHAAAAFLPSGCANAAVLTIDGVGEYQTTVLWQGKGNNIKPLKDINYPHSVGLLYSTFTAFLGFRVNEDEYKLMGMAAYGRPIYKENVYRLIDVKPDGSFKLDLSFFAFFEGRKSWSKKFEKLFGPPRASRQPVSQLHKDIAASLQKVTEEIYIKILKHLGELTNSENVCISGGVGLNAVANGLIYEQTKFKSVYVLGPAGDSGAALGAALFAYFSILKQKENGLPIKNLSWGSFYDTTQIRKALAAAGCEYEFFNSEQDLIVKTAGLLADNKVVGWFDGRMEFGPRALGNRSILANPKPKFMKARINEIKKREQFRPFGCSMLASETAAFFGRQEESWPFMNFCFLAPQDKAGQIAAVVHEDSTVRVQTVDSSNGRFFKLISQFYSLTGVPALLNTSFNLAGEPIVETPEQAIADFSKTNMDYLVIGDFLVSKI